jgi:signal transduction histidine kinase
VPAADDSLADLQLQVAELRASRARLVAVADAERRSIERALHDGAQQHLVALAINLQLAQQLVGSDLEGAKKLLEEIGRDVREALETVRDLAHRIYPPLLLDRGLAEALRAAASGVAARTRVEADGLDRYPPEIEAAVYFCCLEALRNADRHAGDGALATIRVWHDEGTLHFEVGDDGVGFEHAQARGTGTGTGTGLTNVSDWLAGLDGQLAISSDLGRGTRVQGTIPVPR